jgi:nucleotide-binding universal stress UspA family protein
MNTNDEVARANGETPAPRHEVVVGIDETPSSAAALRWAAGHSRATGLPLRLVRTWQMSGLASTAVTSGAAEYLEAAAADARARATQWVLDTLGGDAAEVRWTLEVHEGGAGPVLVAVSRGSQLVVVGTHEHTGLRRAVSGSVSHYVLSHSDVPVVAVPVPVAHPLDAGGRDAAVLGPLL